jgi:hypothetical protein
VDPTRLELVTSAMRRRSEGFAAVHYRSKNRLNKPYSRIVLPRMFTIVRAGCRQIAVSCIREHRVSGEALYKDPHVFRHPHMLCWGPPWERIWKGFWADNRPVLCRMLHTNFAENPVRNCPKSLGRARNVALRATETVLFRPILASVYRPIHGRSVARITFRTVSPGTW